QKVVVRLTNGEGLSATQSFTITVRAINIPPAITSTPPTQGSAGQGYTYAVQASDVDGDPLTYSLTAAPSGMSINASTGLIQWTPTAAQLGTRNVAIAVMDGRGGTATQIWSVGVSGVPLNRPPAITSTPRQAAAAGQLYQYAVTATDPDGPTP